MSENLMPENLMPGSEEISAPKSEDLAEPEIEEISVPKSEELSTPRSKEPSAPRSSASKSKEKTTINEALNEYYKLKSKYETDYQEKYIKPILRSADKSKREKRLEYQKLPKAECINCKRNVGSIFTIKLDPNEYSRTFIASCGDLDDPCPLDINFDYTFRNELNKEMKDADNDINEIKNRIIIDKNNMMFGYVDQEKAIANFNIDTTELKTITEGAGFILDINIQLNDNPIKKDLIKSNEDKLGVEFLLPFKDMIKTFDQTGNTEVLNKAVKFYVEEMVPLITSIRNLKYEVCYVDFVENKDLEDRSEKGDLNFLVQKKNSLYNLEYTLYGTDEVKSFVKGIRGPGKATTRKLHAEPAQIHKKTRKLRPLIELVEEGEEGPQREKGKKDVTSTYNVQTAADLYPELYRRVEGEIMPRVGPGSLVTWLNESGQPDLIYQRTWDDLSTEYKNTLARDAAWMKKTVDYYVEYAKLKRENKLPYSSNREFVHPDGLLLPPNKISDTEYDYGNIFYNSLLNSGDKPGIWITFLPKYDKNIDPILYKGYLDALSAVFKNKFKIARY